MGISCFIINIGRRVDRREHSIAEFMGRSEFNMIFVEAIEDNIGAVGLWRTIRQIVEQGVSLDDDYILICEDDHKFTLNYTFDSLNTSISEAILCGADLLIGGASSVSSVFKVSKSLLWTESYTGNQFMIIFRKFFQHILAAKFSVGEAVDYKFSDMSPNIFLIYPFISTQKEFGYSDVTSINNGTDRVEKLFDDTSDSIKYVLDGAAFYGFNLKDEGFDISAFADSLIPTYVICSDRNAERLLHMEDQFCGREEFEITFESISTNWTSEIGCYNSIKKVIQAGVDNEDDVLIICKDGHEFTDTYSHDILIKNILKAHSLGADILSGGTSGGFGHALPLSENLFWINQFSSDQFLVIYRKFFRRILNTSFEQFASADNFLSELTSNKMVIYPFISVEREFANPTNTLGNFYDANIVEKGFEHSLSRLSKTLEAYRRFR